MGLDISVEKNLVLRSGALWELGTVETAAGHEVEWQKSAYFLADYAEKNLKRVNDGEKHTGSSYCGEFVLPMSAVQDIIKKCNDCLPYEYADDKSPVEKIFPFGQCGLSHYKKYGTEFFGDIHSVLRLLPFVLADLGNDDVQLWLSIG